MANGRQRFEIALQLAQSWLHLAREKPTSHTCRSARQAAEAASIRAEGVRLGTAELDLLHDLMAEVIRLDAHAVVDDAVTAWPAACGRFAGVGTLRYVGWRLDLAPLDHRIGPLPPDMPLFAPPAR